MPVVSMTIFVSPFRDELTLRLLRIPLMSARGSFVSNVSGLSPAVPGTYTAVLKSGAGMNEDAKILVVDDDPDVLDMVADFLALNAFCVVTARNGDTVQSLAGRMAYGNAQVERFRVLQPGQILELKA